jgi:hypothetical protein
MAFVKEKLVMERAQNILHFTKRTSLVVLEVPGSIPGSTMGIFLVGGGSPW